MNDGNPTFRALARSLWRHQPFALTLILFAGLTTLVWWRFRPPEPKALDAPATTFSGLRARAELERLLHEERPHPVGTPANAVVRKRIITRLEELGYEPQVQTSLQCGYAICASVRNVVAALEGKRPAQPAVLLAVHYDSVGAGPGASDDGAGVAATLEIARALKAMSQTERNILLLLDDGEEAGLLGARAFMNEHPYSAHVSEVINLEARGSSGPSLMFETSRDNLPLVRLMSEKLDRPFTTSLHQAVYERLPNDTDFTIFKEWGVVGYNFGFIDGVAHYHTALDDLSHTSNASLQHHGDNALVLVHALANRTAIGPRKIEAADAVAEVKPAEESRGDDAIWFDVLGYTVVWWPISWAQPIAFVGLLLMTLLAVRVLREHRQPAALAAAAGGVVLVPLVAAVIGYVAVSITQGLSGSAEPWYGYPFPTVVAMWAAAASGVMLAAALLSRRGHIATRYLGVWGMWLLAGIATTALVPDASYLFVVPAVVAALVGLATWMWRRDSDARRTQLWALVPCAVAALLWLPVVLGLESAVTLRAHPAITGAGGLLFATALPLLSQSQRRWHGLLLALSTLVPAVVVALVLPTYSAQRPQRVSISYFQRLEDADAKWLVDASWADVPSSLVDLAGLGAPEAPPLQLAGRQRVAIGPAPRVDLPGPEVDVTERSDIGGGRQQLLLHVRSPRNAPVVVMLIPPKYGVTRIGIEGHPARYRRLEASSWWPGYTYVAYSGVPEGGVQFEVTMEATESIDIELLDISTGLPPIAEALIEARAPLGTPSQDGDLTIVSRRASL